MVWTKPCQKQSALSQQQGLVLDLVRKFLKYRFFCRLVPVRSNPRRFCCSPSLRRVVVSGGSSACAGSPRSSRKRARLSDSSYSSSRMRCNKLMVSGFVWKRRRRTRLSCWSQVSGKIVNTSHVSLPQRFTFCLPRFCSRLAYKASHD